MPKCLDCGNEESFGSKEIPGVAPTANGPITGLVANFDREGYISQIESMNGDIDLAQEAWERPQDFFDICYVCGSDRIIWP